MISINEFTKKYKYSSRIVAVLFICIAIFIISGSVAPSDFPQGKIIKISKNTPLGVAANMLVEKGVIRSTFLFKSFVVLIGGRKSIMAGDYLFNQPMSSVSIAYRMVYGIHGLPKIKVTLPEGSTAEDMAWILLKNIPDFDAPRFLALAKPKEGYLFPDTYFFYENTSPEEVFETLRSTFDQKIKTIEADITAFGRPLSDIIKMSSIVDKEASKSSDRRIISGILWKRLDSDMPLQVDPPFGYIIGKGSSQITLSDLATSSPYNLYKYTGLTPTPIGNPGLSTILDTIKPEKTKYWFFLSDSKGNTHYAITYDDHLINKGKYIN